MFKLTLRNLFDKKIRFALTTLSVVTGVMFVVAVFVLTDSLRSSFEGLAEDIGEGTDLTIRVPQEIGQDFDRPTVPENLLATVEAVEGVSDARGNVAANNVVITDDNGDAARPQGPPALGMNWSPSVFFPIEGVEPGGPGEFATDAGTADNYDLVLGNTYAISGPLDQREFELVGIFNFGSPDENTSLGQTMSAFDIETAQDFLGFGDTYIEIAVTVDDGLDPLDVKVALEDTLGRDYEVVTALAVQEETEDDFNEFIDIFNNILLAFALIVVFVAAFIINNTFQIVVGQRIRELGLLRAVGATGRQVANSVMLEGAMVGVFSTVVGLILGRFLGGGIRWLMNQGGFSLPSGPLQLQTRTIVVAILIGMGVTLLSSIIPARRARKISPIAAIQSDPRLIGASLRRRLITGSIITAAGALALAIGLFGGMSTATTLTAIAVGALSVFIGVNTLSPSFARPVAHLLGAPIQRIFGLPGQIARENAARTPRRTASTAGALMIGLALVGMAAVVGASLTTTFIERLDNAVEADYFIQSTAGNRDPSAGFSVEVVEQLEELDELDSVVRYRFGAESIRVGGSNKDVFASEFARVEDHLDADVIVGSIRDADPLNSITMHEDPAEDLGLGIGDTVGVTFPDNRTETLTVAAIYADDAIYGDWMIDITLWDQHFNRNEIAFASATITGFSDDLPELEQQRLLDGSAAAIAPIVEQFPSIKAENRVEFRQSQQSQLDSFLITITVFLGISLFMALIGIANTLALSVFERTREIGLLRAVGMTRRQLRRSIRWEAVIVSVFGALMGILLGVVFGVAAVVAIPDTFINTISIPFVTLLIYVVVAGLAGILAAILPARRASRLDVLEAISYE